MSHIGGFFDLELNGCGESPHPGALALSTGRACIALWLQEMNPERCFVPFYCCDAVFEPMRQIGVEFEFYRIDDSLLPTGLPEVPKKGDWLVWTNFFGMRSERIETLTKVLQVRILLDNTHAFFDDPADGLWSFTSARKYFGVTDGAYCYRANRDASEPQVPRFRPSYGYHLMARYTDRAEDAFDLFRAAEADFDCSIKRISLLSERILAGIDVKQTKKKRRRNFEILKSMLSNHNTLAIADAIKPSSAYCYPLLPRVSVARNHLYDRKLYIPTLWPSVQSRKGKDFNFERKLSRELLPLPIDHRYEESDMVRMAEALLDLIV